MLKRLIVVYTFLALFLSVEAATKAVDITRAHNQIGLSMLYYEDADNSVEFSKISELSEDKFSPLSSSVSTHLFTDSTLYYKFSVLNPQLSKLKRVLLFETPWLDHIEVLIISPEQHTSHYTTGNLYPFGQRAVKHHEPNIEHDFDSGLSTVYVKVKTRDPFVVPISILTREQVVQNQVEDVSLSVFIYGFLLAMILYHFILYTNIKLSYYGFYVLYLLTFIAANLSYNGYTYQWLLPTLPTLQNWLQSTTIFLFVIAGLLFARSFLSLERYLPLAQKQLDILIIVFSATMLLSPLLGYHYHVIFAIALSVVFSVFVFSIALLSLLKGNHYARFFLLGTTAGLIGTSITALTVMSLIPYSDWGYQAIDFGMLVDSILLSFALVDRLKTNEREQAQAIKESRMDALTQLGNRKAFHEFCQQQFKSGSSDNPRRCRALLIDLDSFKQVNSAYGHATGDIVLQRVARLLSRSIKSSDHLFRISGEEFLITLESSNLKSSKQLAERIQTAISSMHINFANHSITITASIGISELVFDNSQTEEVELTATESIYQAKQLGHNNIYIAE